MDDEILIAAMNKAVALSDAQAFGTFDLRAQTSAEIERQNRAALSAIKEIASIRYKHTEYGLPMRMVPVETNNWTADALDEKHPTQHPSLLSVDLNSGIAVTESGVYQPTQNPSPKGYVPKWDGKCSDCGKEGHIRCGDFGIISPGGLPSKAP